MLGLLIVFIFVLLGAALGRRLLRIARFRFNSSAESLPYAAGLGLGVFSLAIMGVGLLDGFGRRAVSIAALAALCALLPDAVALVLQGAKRLRRPRLTTFQWLLVAAVLASLALGLVSSLAPPTAWDAMTSHLKVPLRYLARGGVYRLDDVHSNGPLNTVMLFIPVLRLGGDSAPAALHFAFMVLAGLALYAMARRRLSKTGALLAAATYFLMPISAVLGSEPVVDFAAVLYVVLALDAFLRWCDRPSRAWALLGAVCLGLAAGTKYTGLYAVAILLAAVVIRALADRERRADLLSHAAGAIIVAALVGCPWYVRNAVNTGNPVFPVLANVIPTEHATSEWTGGVRRVTTQPAHPTGLLNFVLFPVNYTLGLSRGIGHGPQASGLVHSPGPLFLAFVPLLLLLRPVPRWAWMLFGFALAAFLLVVPMFPLPRYILPFLVPCSLIVGYAFHRLSAHAGVRRILSVAVVVLFAVQLVPFTGRAAARARVVAGLETREEYLLRVDDVYPMARRVARLQDAKVLYVGERLYHFLDAGVDATMAMPLRQAVFDFPAFPNADDLLTGLRAGGYTHVVVNRAVLKSRRVEFAFHMVRALEDSGLIREVGRDKQLVLYEVTSARPE